MPATIPQIQCQISHELRMAVLHVNCRTQAAHIFCDVIAEDDRAHRGLARAALAHEQHLFLLLTGVHSWRFAVMPAAETAGAFTARFLRYREVGFNRRCYQSFSAPKSEP